MGKVQRAPKGVGSWYSMSGVNALGALLSWDTKHIKAQCESNPMGQRFQHAHTMGHVMDLAPGSVGEICRSSFLL